MSHRKRNVFYIRWRQFYLICDFKTMSFTIVPTACCDINRDSFIVFVTDDVFYFDWIENICQNSSDFMISSSVKSVSLR